VKQIYVEKMLAQDVFDR